VIFAAIFSNDPQCGGIISRAICRSFAARFSVLKGIATAADLRSTRGNEITWRVEDMDRKHFVAAQGFYRCASAVGGACRPCCVLFLRDCTAALFSASRAPVGGCILSSTKPLGAAYRSSSATGARTTACSWRSTRSSIKVTCCVASRATARD
jgi:hypothetical protein